MTAEIVEGALGGEEAVGPKREWEGRRSEVGCGNGILGRGNGMNNSSKEGMLGTCIGGAGGSGLARTKSVMAS